MQLSVVIPTLDGRERLAGCLDVLARVTDVEVIVANGPSTDGTTGMVCERDDVDVLLELAERNVNVARNAGIEASTGDVVALLSDALRPQPGWLEAVEGAIADGADAVTGPVDRPRSDGDRSAGPETGRVAGRTVTFFEGGNVAFSRSALECLDGFDEYLPTGGARDAAHRLAACDSTVAWTAGMAAGRSVATDGGSSGRSSGPHPQVTDGGSVADWGWTYRALAYRLGKNYGVRPAVLRRLFGRALGDATTGISHVFDGETTASAWLASGRAAGVNVVRGLADGIAARVADRSASRNPNGVSGRADRAVTEYDWR